MLSQRVWADVVYDNTTTRSTPPLFTQSGFEFGDEIVLAGGSGRFLTNFIFEYYGLNFSGNEMARLRLYRNDVLYGESFYGPGTLLYDSGDFSISATMATLSFVGLNVSVPTNFTWTVEFTGIEAGESAGLTLYDPPTVGSNYADYWECSGTNGSWVLRTRGSPPPVSFGAQASAAPLGMCELYVPAVNSPFAVGSGPGGIWLGDLRGVDDWRDMVVANSGDDTVSVLLFLGEGNFVGAGTYAVGDNPQGVTTEDFNGDGYHDIAVANYGSGTVSVLINQLCGLGFSARTDYPVGAGPKSVAVANVNHDGYLDLVVANNLGNSVSVLRGIGGGVFNATVATYAVGVAPSSVAVGDFNGDGWVDVLTANELADTLAILTNKQDGTFDGLHPITIALPGGSRPTYALPARFYDSVGVRDDILDIAATASGSDEVHVLIGQVIGGAWSVKGELALPLGTNSNPRSLLVRDLNRDGIPDLAVANGGENNVQILLHKSDGTFDSRGTVPVGGSPAIVVGSNLNEDDATDLAVTIPGDNRVCVLLFSGALASDQTVSVKEDEQPAPQFQLKGRVLGGGALDYYIESQGTNGIAAVVGFGPYVTYTQTNANYFGHDTFTYYTTPVGQPELRSMSATVTVNIQSVNDAPSFSFTPDFILQGKTNIVMEDALLTGAFIVDTNSLSAGGEPYESKQAFTFVLIPDDRGLFATQPAIKAGTGKLSFRPARGRTAAGTRVAVYSRDSGGTANGGINVSPTNEFWIQIRPNPLKLAGGQYNGLFYETGSGGVRHASSGFFTLTIWASGTSANGSFTGKLTGDGGRYAFTGQFDEAGRARAVPVYRPNNSTLYLDLDLDFAGKITGTVTAAGNVWTAALEGYRVTFDAVLNPAPQAGRYTMAFPGDDANPAQSPGGDGYGLVSVSSGGFARVAGKLGDGTSFTQAASLSSDGAWPFYVLLYGGHGSIFGWVTFVTSPERGFGTNMALAWIKVAPMTSGIYRNGFTNQITFLGSRYDAPASGQRVLPLTYGILAFRGGNLSGVSAPTAYLATLTDANAVLVDGAQYLQLTSPSSGLMTGRFVHPSLRGSRYLRGVVLQEQNAVRGYFTGTNQTGSVRLDAL